MEILGKWGAYLFVPQVLLGGMMSVFALPYEVSAPVFGFGTAGIIAVVYVVGGMICNKPICVALAGASVAFILAILSFFSGSVFAGICSGLFSLIPAFLAAALVQKERPSARESLSQLVFGAMPGIWPTLFMLGVFPG